jgi:DNA polymerase III psi subunit
MSLLSNNVQALHILFNEELYAIGDTKENKVPGESISLDYLGGNNRFFLLLVNSPNEKYLEKQFLDLLLKILQAKGLQQEDVAILNIANQPPCSFEDLQTFFACAKICLFGIAPATLGLANTASNEPFIHEGVRVLATFSLAELAQTQHKKVAFWNVMKAF